MKAVRLVALSAVAGAGILLSQGTAMADTCTTTSAYSDTCVPPPATQVLPSTQVKGERFVNDTSDTLPFTGGEVALLSTIGAAVLGGGLVLVAAGRRRKATES